jgi:hypothetical protein
MTSTAYPSVNSAVVLCRPSLPLACARPVADGSPSRGARGHPDYGIASEARRVCLARPTFSPSAASVWAVRLDRPDGTHCFVGPERDGREAGARCDREQRQWAAAGIWAPSPSIVTMTAAAFVDHARNRPNCSSGDCPRSAASHAQPSSKEPPDST